MIEAQKMMTKR